MLQLPQGNADMTPASMTRRDALSLLAVGASTALSLQAHRALADDGDKKRSAPQGGIATTVGKHAPVPLPFDPTKLAGLSEKLLVSHHDNNYAGAVKNLNAVEEQLRTVTKDTPGFLVAGLRERELTFTNSVILHEHYFANLGGDGKASGSIQKALSDAFEGFGRFEELFRATGMSLAGGSGWTILELGLHNGELRVYGSANHTQALAFGCPLLVMDMYEHAYQMDFGAAAAKYVDAFFANIRWDEVSKRHQRALAARKALRG
jgi:Fe-Mn family superoxide dismutase